MFQMVTTTLNITSLTAVGPTNPGKPYVARVGEATGIGVVARTAFRT